MFQGIIYIIFSGICWCLNGIVFSYTAKKSMNFIQIVLISTSLSTIIAWVYFLNYSSTNIAIPPKAGMLSVIMIISGMICSFGLIIMQKAMQKGHHGIVYSISQSAMIIPFLYSIIVFNESITLFKTVGIALIILSFIAFGTGQSNSIKNDYKSPFKFWFSLAISSFLIIGIHQILTLLPIYWPNWTDSSNMRVPLLFTGFSIGYIFIFFTHKTKIEKRSILFALMLIPLALPSQFIFYRGMDIFAKLNIVSVAYPLAVGTNIIAFVIYSLFFLKEKSPKIYIAGVLIGVSGLMLLAI